jgi:hypothetical protein
MMNISPFWNVAALEFREDPPGMVFCMFISDGENAVQEGFYFEFRHFIDDQLKEQHVRNGSDSYCIVNESLGVHYGGLEKVFLMPDLLVLVFNDEAVEALQLPESVIPLGIAAGVDVDALRRGLQRILRYGDPQSFPELHFG